MCFVPLSSLLRQIKRLFRSCCFFFVSKIHLSKTEGDKMYLASQRNSMPSELNSIVALSLALSLLEDLQRPRFRILSLLILLLTLRALVCAIPPRPASVWQSCLAIASSPSGLIHSWLELQNGKVPLAIVHQRENARVIAGLGFCLGVTASLRSVNTL